MVNQSRRRLLKGIGYTMAISTGIASSAVMALSKPTAKVDTLISASPANDITVFQQKTGDKEVVTLMNLTDKTVTLDSFQPVKLEHVNGSLVVKVNAVPSDGTVAMLPGERFTFDIEAVSANLINKQEPVPNLLANHLKLNSEHPSFNMVVPVAA